MTTEDTSPPLAARLALGSAQFGLPYGITNLGGQTSAEEVAQIVRLAYVEGMECIDTASLYGTAEASLGQAFRWLEGQLEPSLEDDEEGEALFAVVSKTPKFANARLKEADGHTLVKACRQSLKHLGMPALYGLLVHDANDLLKPGGEYLFDALYELKDEGLVAKVGVSVYDAEQIDGLLRRLPLDMLQLPLSVLDQRLLRSGHVGELAAQGWEIHARSAFLQGLLFAAPDKLPPAFAGLAAPLAAVQGMAAEQHCSVAQLALKFLLQQPEISQVVCGVTHAAQLAQLLSALSGLSPLAQGVEWAQGLAVNEPALLNPALWPHDVKVG